MSNISVSPYSQPNNKLHSKAFPLTPPVWIDSQITNLNKQMSHSLRQCIFTVLTQISLHSRPTQSKRMYLQTNQKPQPTVAQLSQSAFTVQSQTSLKSLLTHYVRLYSQFNYKPQSTVVHSLRKYVWTLKSQTSKHIRPTHSVSL
jgi:hypothetical protein